MALSLATTFELRQLFVEARQFFLEESRKKIDWINYLLRENPRNNNLINREHTQLATLQAKGDRFEYLAAVVVVQPEKEGTNPFCLRPSDVSVPNHVSPVSWYELNFVRNMYNFCYFHQQFDCNMHE